MPAINFQYLPIVYTKRSPDRLGIHLIGSPIICISFILSQKCQIVSKRIKFILIYKKKFFDKIL